MKYLVIGLGNLGRAIAASLTQIGDEVIGVDSTMLRVEAVKGYTSGAVQLDATDPTALSTLPLNEMDAIIVTFGKDIGTSIQSVAVLKSLGAGKLIVRAISPIHETIIRAIGVSEIITPEQDFAEIYASMSSLGGLFKQWYKVTETHHLYKVKTPSALVGQSLGTIKPEENFGFRLVGIERPEEVRNLIGLKQTHYKVIDDFDAKFTLEANDVLIIFCRMEVLKKLADI